MNLLSVIAGKNSCLGRSFLLHCLSGQHEDVWRRCEAHRLIFHVRPRHITIHYVIITLHCVIITLRSTIRLQPDDAVRLFWYNKTLVITNYLISRKIYLSCLKENSVRLSGIIWLWRRHNLDDGPKRFFLIFWCRFAIFGLVSSYMVQAPKKT